MFVPEEIIKNKADEFAKHPYETLYEDIVLIDTAKLGFTRGANFVNEEHIKKWVELAQRINQTNVAMSEYYMQHNYREMFSIWQQFANFVQNLNDYNS